MIRGTALVLPAAGGGTRFGGPIAKQLLPLRGVPVIRRSLDAFVGLVDGAIVPVSAALHDAVAEALAGSPVPVQLVTGGATRLRSVAAGLAALPESCTRVLIHDAVRPFVSRASICACLAALERHAAAVVAVPCSDSVKRASSDTPTLATSSVAREGLWLAQTPQGLRRSVAQAAFARAIAEHWECTDDVQVLERCGHAVALITGDRRNLKITTPEDWALAEALLAAGASILPGQGLP